MVHSDYLCMFSRKQRSSDRANKRGKQILTALTLGDIEFNKPGLTVTLRSLVCTSSTWNCFFTNSDNMQRETLNLNGKELERSCDDNYDIETFVRYSPILRYVMSCLCCATSLGSTQQKLTKSSRWNTPKSNLMQISYAKNLHWQLTKKRKSVLVFLNNHEGGSTTKAGQWREGGSTMKAGQPWRRVNVSFSLSHY